MVRVRVRVNDQAIGHGHHQLVQTAHKAPISSLMFMFLHHMLPQTSPIPRAASTYLSGALWQLVELEAPVVGDETHLEGEGCE